MKKYRIIDVRIELLSPIDINSFRGCATQIMNLLFKTFAHTWNIKSISVK